MNIKPLEPAKDGRSSGARVRIFCRECEKGEIWNYATGNGWAADCDQPHGACYICNDCLDAYKAARRED